MENTDHSIVAALTADHITRITGLSNGQLRAWDKRGFFKPKYGYVERSAAYSRIYSFADAVGLRTLAELRNKYHISIRELEKTADRLLEKGFNHWASVKLYVLKKKVYFQDPKTNRVESLSDGQFAMLEVINVIADVENKVKSLKVRTKEQIGKIEKNRFVARNAAVLSGTRIPAATIQRFSDAGYSIAQIIAEYPTLKKEDILAALNYKADDAA